MQTITTWQRSLRLFLLAALFLNPFFNLAPAAGAPAVSEKIETTLRGYFIVVRSDRAEGAESAPHRFLLAAEAGRTFEVQVTDAALALDKLLSFDRQSVAVQNFRTSRGGTILLVESADIHLDPRALFLSPPSGSLNQGTFSGTKRWVSILCKFADDPNEPHPRTFFQEMYRTTFPGLDHFWRELSYDAVQLTGSGAVGWYVLPQPKSYYLYDMDGDGSADFDLNRSAADCTALADTDVYYPDYFGVSVVFNSGIGTAAGAAWGGQRVLSYDGLTAGYGFAWLSAYSSVATFAHEMGHAFGLPHSSGEYGQVYDNYWDIMSVSGGTYSVIDPDYSVVGQHTIAYHKDFLGWIPPDQVFTAAPGSPVTITLERLALPQSTAYKMAKIPLNESGSQFYTVEVRQKTGYDLALPGSGVIIHQVDTSRAEPAHVVDVDLNGDTGDAGAIWLAGETFTDSGHGVTVTVESAAASSYQVTITLAGEVNFRTCADRDHIPTAECSALVALYQSTNGPHWANSTDQWLKKNNPCLWYGVTCSEGHVRLINMEGNNLDGEIPDDVRFLTELERLLLPSNYLSGNLPAALGSLSRLKAISLGDNEFSGSIPEEYGQLQELNSLNVYGNQLTGSIPPELGNLKHIVMLSLHRNQLSGSIPPQLGSIGSSNPSGNIYIFLNDNHLTGSIPAELGNIASLSRLDLYNNRLGGGIPAQLGNLTGLDSLALSNNALVGEIPAAITQLSDLKELYIDHNGLWSSNAAVTIFINGLQPGWQDTQTTAPGNLRGEGGYDTIDLAWDPIPYQSDGGYYEISYATNAGGPFQVGGITASKSVDHYLLQGLAPGTTYYFRLRTFTPADFGQQNDLWSVYSTVYPVSTHTLKAEFSASPVSGTAPLAVNFTNLSTSGFSTCLWSFGDGETSTSCGSLTHTYTAEGQYTVSLQVSGSGKTDKEEKAGYITVTHPLPPPYEPTGLVALPVSQSRIALSWADNSPDESDFHIERTPDGTSSWMEIATVGANTGSYNDDGLACGTPYNYRVRAHRHSDNSYSSYSGAVYAETRACPPAAPSDLSAAAVSPSQINLSWTDNASDESDFHIERSPNGTSSWTEIATVGASITTYNNTGLTCGSTYYYRVRAQRHSDNSYSTYSTTANATTTACPPGAPTNLSATAVSPSQINLSWTDNATNESDFHIERSLNGSSSWTEIATVSANVTTYSNTGLSANTAYFYRVRAQRHSDNQYSIYSNTANATTPADPPPSAPSNLTASVISQTQINLNWTDNASNESDFYIERSPSGTSGWAEIATVNANVTTYSNTGLSCGTPYYYRVRAQRHSDNLFSGYSNVAQATTQSCQQTLAAPSELNAFVVLPDRIDLSWKDNAQDETAFFIEQSTIGEPDWVTIEIVGPNITHHSITGLTGGTYFYRIRAYRTGDGAFSSYSNTASASLPLPEEKIYLPVIVR